MNPTEHTHQPTARAGFTRGRVLSGLVLAGLCGAIWLAESLGGSRGTLLATQVQAADVQRDREPARKSSAGTQSTTATGHADPAHSEHEETLDVQPGEAAHIDTAPSKPLFADNPMVGLASRLRERELELDKREAAIATREKQLLALQGELDATLKKTQAMRDEMNTLAGNAATKRRAELEQWIAIHETMKAAQSAQMIGAMDDSFAMELLAAMDVKKSSKILSELVNTNRKKATALAQRLEQQNK